MEHEQKLEEMMRVGDATAVGVVVGSWVGFLPAVASLLTILYMAIRVWETKTVIGWRNAFKHMMRK